MTIYKIKQTKKYRTCGGCNKIINKESSCIYTTSSYKGFAYKDFFHSNGCLKLFEKRKNELQPQSNN